VRDLLRLTRPVDFLLFVAAVLLGGWLASGAAAFGGDPGRRLLLAALAGACVGIGANVVNDVYDVEIDRLNRPDRPLPAGLVTVGAAWALWVALSATGVALGLATSPAHGAVAAASVALVWAYAAWLKRVPAVGHLIVGAMVALGVLYGAMAVRDARAGRVVLAGAGLAMVLVAAREVVKAIPDVVGDREGGALTLPVVLGPRRAARVALVVVLLVVAALPLFPLVGFSPLFLAYVVPMAACLLASAWALLVADARVHPWAPAAGRASGWMKAALALGVVALALGR
jgi:geranylgeranylglycerol-phosphate geranylgeranyltransferase